MDLVKRTNDLQELAQVLTGERVGLIWADPTSQAEDGVATKSGPGYIISLKTGMSMWETYEEFLYQCARVFSRLKLSVKARGVDYQARTWHSHAMKMTRDYLSPEDGDETKIRLYMAALKSFWDFWDPDDDELFEQMWEEQGGK
jgi:hypothetical protein